MLSFQQQHTHHSSSYSDLCHRRPSLKRHRCSQGQARSLCVKMRTANASSSASSSGRLKADLARIVRQVHKTASDHNIGSDSGVSFSGEASSSQHPYAKAPEVPSPAPALSRLNRLPTVLAPSPPTIHTPKDLPRLRRVFRCFLSSARCFRCRRLASQLKANEAFFPPIPPSALLSRSRLLPLRTSSSTTSGMAWRGNSNPSLMCCGQADIATISAPRGCPQTVSLLFNSGSAPTRQHPSSNPTTMSSKQPSRSSAC